VLSLDVFQRANLFRPRNCLSPRFFSPWGRGKGKSNAHLEQADQHEAKRQQGQREAEDDREDKSYRHQSRRLRQSREIRIDLIASVPDGGFGPAGLLSPRHQRGILAPGGLSMRWGVLRRLPQMLVAATPNGGHGWST
jgi:hypothetical protein